MSEAILSPAINILKLLTPLAIMSMTKSVKQQNRVSLTRILISSSDISGDFPLELEDVIDSIESNILENKNNSEVEKEAKEGGEGEEKARESDLGRESSFGDDDGDGDGDNEKKNNFRDAQRKLKKREVIEMYRETSSLKIVISDKENKENGENLDSAQYGTLLDKKQH